MGHCHSSDKLDNHDLRLGKLEKDFDNIQTPTGKYSVWQSTAASLAGFTKFSSCKSQVKTV